MKALFELFRRFDARRIFGFIRRLGGMSRPKVKCYDLRSTRALRVEGDLLYETPYALLQDISIHALRVEGDMEPCISTDYATAFLSTPSGWRATYRFNYELDGCDISIHALRVEGDTGLRISDCLALNFYPRPPGGERLRRGCPPALRR